MPGPIAPLIGFVLGACFAWYAADETDRSGSAPSRSLVLASAFGLVVFAPISVFFLAFAPDWAFAYLLDTRRLPGIVTLSLGILNAASVPLGFLAGSRSAAARQLSGLLRLILPPGLAALAFVLATLPRLSVHATYAQYHGDFGARPAAGSLLGWALLWMALVLGGAIAWTLRGVRRFSEAARRD